MHGECETKKGLPVRATDQKANSTSVFCYNCSRQGHFGHHRPPVLCPSAGGSAGVILVTQADEQDPQVRQEGQVIGPVETVQLQDSMKRSPIGVHLTPPEKWKCPPSSVVIGRYTQDVARRTLPTGRCPQDSAHRTLPTGRCPQDAAHRMLPSGRCPQDAALRTLPKERCPQDAALRTLPSGRCPQDAAHRTLPTCRCPQGAAYRTLPT
ncbi:hypothetical protein NFI96_011492 [Prochilodus magdalenae]|nr:hypothetical protein NFI96_011492 [Prochilodus magdalenae]